jgi:putative drug exporter of the RND superfamily
MRSTAKWCFRNRWAVVIAWVLAIVAVNAVHASLGSNYADDFELPHTQSFAADRLLEHAARRASGDTEQVVIAVRHGHVTDPAVRARVDRLLARLARVPHVTQVASPYAADKDPSQIAPAGRVAFATLTFDVDSDAISERRSKQFVALVRAASGGGVEFAVGGQIAEDAEPQTTSTGLPIGFAAAGLVLLAVFGTLLAALLPLLTAAVSLGVASALVALLSNVVDMASFSSELALLIGLGVGVDYALFIVTRYRQGVMRGLEREEAVAQALDTSGRAVMFAGIIVVIAMLGMCLLGVGFLYGVAIAAAVTVAFTIVAALTLLPALLSLFGHGVMRRRERRAIRERRYAATDESPAWCRWAAVLERRPAAFAAVAVAAMAVVTIPFFSMRLGSTDSSADPAGSTTREAYDLLATGFGPGYNGPLELVARVSSRAQRARFDAVVRTIGRTPGVVGVTRPQFMPGRHGGAGVALAEAYPRNSPEAASTSALLHALRGAVIPAATAGSGLRVLVGGETAVFDDFSGVLTQKLPLFVGIVVLMSFLLLTVVFRSLVVPLTAALMNLLATGAALGVVTAVFQYGWGASLIGITSRGPIEAFLPVILFPILFGLSMDYEVFLVIRIYEEWHRRGDPHEAVKHGLAATGGTITAAAAIMILVFAAFMLGGQWVISLFGLGLSSAVFIDALIIRSIVVPAVMLMLGETNWTLPASLERLIPHLRVEGSADAEPVIPGAPAPAAGPA